MERNYVVAVSTKFLREIKQVKQYYNNVFMNEIWGSQNYTAEKYWTVTASPKATGVRQSTGKGSRLINYSSCWNEKWPLKQCRISVPKTTGIFIT